MTAWVDLKSHDGVRLADKEGKEIEKDKWEDASDVLSSPSLRSR